MGKQIACPGRAADPLKQSPWISIGLHLAYRMHTGLVCEGQSGQLI